MHLYYSQPVILNNTHNISLLYVDSLDFDLVTFQALKNGVTKL